MNRRMTRPWSRVAGVTVFVVGAVIAVWGRASAPSGRYTIASGVVHDTRTNLSWQQVISLSMFTQAEAASYCANLGLAGTTWRLPTMREILTIVDISVAPRAVTGYRAGGRAKVNGRILIGPTSLGSKMGLKSTAPKTIRG